MKLLSITAMAFLIGTSTASQPVDETSVSPTLDGLYACLIFPLCDPDNYSPVLQPKDKKVDTQDKAKDNKMA